MNGSNVLYVNDNSPTFTIGAQLQYVRSYTQEENSAASSVVIINYIVIPVASDTRKDILSHV